MRAIHKTVARLGIGALAVVSHLSGCSDDANKCELTSTCAKDGATYSEDAGPPPTPPGCDKSPSDPEADVLRDACGYFVDSINGNDTNAGTEAAPFKTLGKAVSSAGKARIYACGSFDERLNITAGVSIFGGFDCTSTEWKYDASKKTKIAPTVPPADGEVPATLRVTAGASTTQLEDLSITAPDATSAGGSSIAVIADGATVALARVDLSAGMGAAGTKPAQPTDNIGPNDPEDPAIRGKAGQTACMGGPAGNPGGAATANMLCGESIGGKGGNGQETQGDPGEDGLPMVSGFGAGGAGEGAMQCKPGGDGANGTVGMAGDGATATGSLDATKGYVGGTGKPGGKATNGQGGGGGGGAKGKAGCFGASGGGGGAGGCGGNGGLGGTYGGSSIALVSINATLTFDTVSMTRGIAGNGGDGGDGQFGGAGGTGGWEGFGGSGLTKACAGGAGGTGGTGGQGGGGTGGHSLGIAFKGKAPETAGITFTPPPANAAGTGGAGTGPTGSGANGKDADTLEIP